MVLPRHPGHENHSLRYVLRSSFLFLVVLVAAAALSGCISISGVFPEPGQETDDTRYDENGTDDGGNREDGSNFSDDTGDSPGTGDNPDEELGPIFSGYPSAEEEQRFFRVTEDYWMETPWFAVSSVIVVVRRGPPQSRIVVPPGSLLEGPMETLDTVVPALSADHQRNDIGISVRFHLGDIPPFVDADRYNHPEFYY